jgi:hypothetical protein
VNSGPHGLRFPDSDQLAEPPEPRVPPFALLTLMPFEQQLPEFDVMPFDRVQEVTQRTPRPLPARPTQQQLVAEPRFELLQLAPGPIESGIDLLEQGLAPRAPLRLAEDTGEHVEDRRISRHRSEFVEPQPKPRLTAKTQHFGIDGQPHELHHVEAHRRTQEAFQRPLLVQPALRPDGDSL